MSDAGLTVWDANGNVVFDTTTQAVKMLGKINLGASYGSPLSGSISVPMFAKGRPFYMIISLEFAILLNRPSISVSGTNLTWNYPVQYPNNPPTQPNVQVIYGIY